MPSSARYSSGGNSTVHQQTTNNDFCAGQKDCWRDNFSTQPLVWDFYRNAVSQPDQLRQRIAFALQQILVISGNDLNGTYGFRSYYNNLLNLSFGNYRDVLKKVSLSPVMGDFLNNVNNDKAAPNENYAREMLQLFAIGTCELNPDATLKGDKCNATYTNEQVRAYAYALTGWTYPAGGKTPYGCWPKGSNCRYYDGDMVPIETYHDTAARQLLGGFALPTGHTAPAALETVLDSLMAHPNIGPFIGRQLIQHLVSSNPTPAYVTRVAQAFNSGKFANYGSGKKGDLSASIAAILLDPEARGNTPLPNAGKLREPAQMFAGVLRALGGRTDGEALSYWWGDQMRQHVFVPPSVFNFYPPNYPVPGTDLVGPTFGIHNANTALGRFNFLTYLIDWDGSKPANSTVPDAVGTQVDLSAFLSSADDAAVLVDRLSQLATGTNLPTAARAQVINASAWWTAAKDAKNWRLNRVKAAAYLVFTSPNYQVQR
jgi:uncharacterized protein (DUF1800 family)